MKLHSHIILLSGCVITAHGVDESYVPIIQQGEVEIELQTFFAKDHRDSRDGAAVYELAFEFAPFQRLELGIAAEWEKNQSASELEMEAFEFKAKILLIEPQSQPFELGILTGIEVAREREEHPDALFAKLLFQYDPIMDFTSVINVEAKQEIGPLRTDETSWSALAGTRWRLSNAFQPGLEWQGDFGAFHHSESAQYLGLTAQGKILKGLTPGAYLSWQLGTYAGLNPAATDMEVHGLLSYEFFP